MSSVLIIIVQERVLITRFQALYFHYQKTIILQRSNKKREMFVVSDKNSSSYLIYWGRIFLSFIEKINVKLDVII